MGHCLGHAGVKVPCRTRTCKPDTGPRLGMEEMPGQTGEKVAGNLIWEKEGGDAAWGPQDGHLVVG